MRISAVAAAILIAVFSTAILTTPASAGARKHRRRTRHNPSGLRVEPTSVPVPRPTAERYKKIDEKEKKYYPEFSLQNCIIVVIAASLIRAFSKGEDTDLRRSKIA